jgi:hypothetical protein
MRPYRTLPDSIITFPGSLFTGPSIEVGPQGFSLPIKNGLGDDTCAEFGSGIGEVVGRLPETNGKLSFS